MRRRDRDIIERNRAGSSAVEAGDGAQQRRFSTSGTADDGDDLPQPDVGGETLERVDAVGIDLAKPIENEHQAAPFWRPKASCQRSSGAEPISISQSVVLPRMAKITIAARICAGLPSCWPSIRR